MADPAIITSIQSYLQVLKLQGIPVDFGVLYGSHARGDASRWSDIDLLVVSPLFDHERTWNTVRPLWRAVLDADERIEPVGVGTRQWEDNDSMALIDIAHREGQIIHPV
ncbi:MAG: nucleotidyltransferase domain-containing protein [Magnetococcales bacterium]|nr:nucleotidyltransferase domain-containing protein [Magnetococcales bacterium]